jgi:hypothetical protein
MIILVNTVSRDGAAANGNAVVHGLYAIYTTQARQRVMGDTAPNMEASQSRECESQGCSDSSEGLHGAKLSCSTDD